MRQEYLSSGEERIELPDIGDTVNPLTFEDVEGGFYLLAAGIFVSTVVHCSLIVKVKIESCWCK